MGDNIPVVGEHVAYYSPDGSETVTFARVLAVTFWDLVDLELSPGVVLRDVRREVVMADGTVIARAGRWARMHGE